MDSTEKLHECKYVLIAVHGKTNSRWFRRRSAVLVFVWWRHTWLVIISYWWRQKFTDFLGWVVLIINIISDYSLADMELSSTRFLLLCCRQRISPVSRFGTLWTSSDSITSDSNRGSIVRRTQSRLYHNGNNTKLMRLHDVLDQSPVNKYRNLPGSCFYCRFPNTWLSE